MNGLEDMRAPFFVFPAAEGKFLVFSRPVASFPGTRADGAETLAVSMGGWIAGGLPYPGPAGGSWSVFSAPQVLDYQDLLEHTAAHPVFSGPLSASLDFSAYKKAFDLIKEAQARGECYQANLCFRLSGKAVSPGPWAPRTALKLWLELLRPGGDPAAGQGKYASFALMDGDCIVASLSPERFFSLEGDRAFAQPMKGTAARGKNPEEDEARGRGLRESEKERAENLMIADMLRNDLGRIALPGGVSAPALFEIEALPSLWQMTSRIEALLRPGTGLADILEALHPCASISGAPKLRAMEILRAAEGRERLWYTGSMGWYRPATPAIPRAASFSVLIRTLLFPDASKPEFSLGVGGGIVWDGRAEPEYGEALLKARFMEPVMRSFSLTEAILWEEERGFFLAERHERRLAASCAAWGGRLVPGAFQAALEGALEKAREAGIRGDLKLRVLVDPAFALSAEAEALSPTPALYHCALSPRRLGPESLPYRLHKTTERSCYSGAHEAGVDQLIFLNERGELTESTSMNILIEREGRLLTPASSSGLLPGTYRDLLIERGEIEEAVLTEDDLRRAEGFWLINSVRRKVVGRLSP